MVGDVQMVRWKQAMWEKKVRAEEESVMALTAAAATS